VAFVDGKDVKCTVNLYEMIPGSLKLAKSSPRTQHRSLQRPRLQVADPGAARVAQREGSGLGEPAIEPHTIVGCDAFYNQIVIQREYPERRVGLRQPTPRRWHRSLLGSIQKARCRSERSRLS
jgi:hypothetical protein